MVERSVCNCTSAVAISCPTHTPTFHFNAGFSPIGTSASIVCACHGEVHRVF